MAVASHMMHALGICDVCVYCSRQWHWNPGCPPDRELVLSLLAVASAVAVQVFVADAFRDIAKSGVE